MPPQVRAILWAQWRSLFNYRSGEGAAGRVLAGFLAVLWYSLWAGLGITATSMLADLTRTELLRVLPWGLMSVFVYWQLAPIVTASLGASLDFRKLLVYPIPERLLFGIEVLLRLTTGMEMILVLAGALAGLLRNPQVPLWGPLSALPVFAAFNLMAAAGFRNLLERLLQHRHIREAAMFVLVLAAAVPQLIAVAGPPAFLRRFFSRDPSGAWPWAVFGRLAAGDPALPLWGLAVFWMALAYGFGRWQFRRSLRFDRSAAQAGGKTRERTASITDRLYTLPARLLPDPLAAVVEKELRSLFRSPRFRLVFLMGFSFGFLIWVPMFRGRSEGLSENYPIFVSLYALLLLSEVLFWNVFGLDRSAVQVYYTAPVPFSRVMIGKNLAGALLVVLEVTVVLLVSRAIGAKMSTEKIFEVYSVSLVMCLYLLGLGNLGSLYYPRPVNPEQSWGRATSAKFQSMLMLLYPVLAIPVLLAYGARYAFESEALFYAMLALAAGIGAIFYWVALDSALEAAERRKERLIETLSASAGPVVMQ